MAINTKRYNFTLYYRETATGKEWRAFGSAIGLDPLDALRTLNLDPQPGNELIGIHVKEPDRRL